MHSLWQQEILNENAFYTYRYLSKIKFKILKLSIFNIAICSFVMKNQYNKSILSNDNITW